MKYSTIVGISRSRECFRIHTNKGHTITFKSVKEALSKLTTFASTLGSNATRLRHEFLNGMRDTIKHNPHWTNQLS